MDEEINPLVGGPGGAVLDKLCLFEELNGLLKPPKEFRFKDFSLMPVWVKRVTPTEP